MKFLPDDTLSKLLQFFLWHMLEAGDFLVFVIGVVDLPTKR